MNEKVSKRIRVSLEPALHAAIRLKSIHTERPVSAIVNDAVRELLRDDLEDLAAYEDRGAEPVMTYGSLVLNLKWHRKI